MAQKSRYRVLLGFLIAFPLGVIALPSNWLDNGPTLCLSKILFHQECYACGMTRACMRLAHGQLAEAGHFNKLAYLVFPLLALFYLSAMLKVAALAGLPVPEKWLLFLRKVRM